MGRYKRTLAKASLVAIGPRIGGGTCGLFAFRRGRGAESCKEFVEPAHRGAAGRLGCSGCLGFPLSPFRLRWLLGWPRRADAIRQEGSARRGGPWCCGCSTSTTWRHRFGEL